MNTPFKKSVIKRDNPLTLETEKTVEQSQERVQTKKVIAPTKEKYTAVMEKDLRIRVKIASAKKNLQFSQFIEEAVLEKLEREGL